MAKRATRCDYCDGIVPAGEHVVTVHRARRGRHFIFEQVPARVCRGCGERYFSHAVAKRMERLMSSRKKHRTVAVPVIPFRAAG